MSLFVVTKGVIHARGYKSSPEPPTFGRSPAFLKSIELVVTLAGAAAFFFLLTRNNIIKLTILAAFAVAADFALRYLCYYFAVKRRCSTKSSWRRCDCGNNSLKCMSTIKCAGCEPARRTLRRAGHPVDRTASPRAQTRTSRPTGRRA